VGLPTLTSPNQCPDPAAFVSAENISHLLAGNSSSQTLEGICGYDRDNLRRFFGERCCLKSLAILDLITLAEVK